MRRRAYFILPRSSPPRIAVLHRRRASPPSIAASHFTETYPKSRNPPLIRDFHAISMRWRLGGAARKPAAPRLPRIRIPGPFQHSAHRMLITPLNLRARGRLPNRATCTCGRRARRCLRACSSSSAPGSRPSLRYSPSARRDLTKGRPWAS